MQLHRTGLTLVAATAVVASAAISAPAHPVVAQAKGVQAKAAPAVTVAASATPDRIVLNPTTQPQTSQSITWRTRFSTFTGRAEYRIQGSSKTKQQAASEAAVPLLIAVTPARHHTAKLRDLTPGTTYEYRVGSSAGWSDWSTFTTAPQNPGAWEFLYFGDAQKGLGDVWPAVADQAYRAHPDAQVTIAAGDMINDSEQDDQWAQWFAGLPQTRTNNLITTPGNHEYTVDPLLTQYLGHFDYPENGPALRGETVWFTDYQGVRFVSLNANAPLGGIDQALWLDRVLSDNPNKWTVVTFHQPIFSGSPGRDNLATRLVWLPILEKHDVDLVLQGHDHTYARGYLASNETATGSQGPVYVVSNAGGKHYELAGAETNNWVDNGARRVVGVEGVSSYQSVQVRGDRLVYRAMVAHVSASGSPQGLRVGDVLDAFTVHKDSAGIKQVVEDPRTVR